MGVAQQYLYTLLAAQLLFIRTLNALLTDIVACLVVIVFLNITGRHLSHITQEVGCIGIDILSKGAVLHIETRETEHLFLEDTEVLFRQLTHKELLGKAGIARVLVTVLDILHALDKILLGDSQCVTELHGVDTILLFVHHHHQVVGILVIYQ